MQQLTANPMFGILLSIFGFSIGNAINKRIKSPLANPLLISVVIIIFVLQIFHIPLKNFNQGGDVISMFLAPATAVLAISIYREVEILKKNFLPILAGTLVGSAVAMGSAYFLCNALGLDPKLRASMMPKSVTTAIAMEVSKQFGGIVPVTVAAVVCTGIFGAVFAPFLVKLFRVKNPVAVGIAIGTSSHALGTTTAVKIGEVEGAMSGVAIGIAGIMTVLIALFL